MGARRTELVRSKLSCPKGCAADQGYGFLGRLASPLPEELGVLRLELFADVFHLTRGDGLLQGRCDHPGVAGGLGLLGAFLLTNPPVELREREVVLAALASQGCGDLLGELIGEVVRLVARDPLSKGLEGGPNSSLGLLVGTNLPKVLYPSENLVTIHMDPSLSSTQVPARIPIPTHEQTGRNGSLPAPLLPSSIFSRR